MYCRNGDRKSKRGAPISDISLGFSHYLYRYISRIEAERVSGSGEPSGITIHSLQITSLKGPEGYQRESGMGNTPNVIGQLMMEGSPGIIGY